MDAIPYCDSDPTHRRGGMAVRGSLRIRRIPMGEIRHVPILPHIRRGNLHDLAINVRKRRGTYQEILLLRYELDVVLYR